LNCHKTVGCGTSHVMMYTVSLTIMERTRVLYGSDVIFYILLTGKLD